MPTKPAKPKKPMSDQVLVKDHAAVETHRQGQPAIPPSHPCLKCGKVTKEYNMATGFTDGSRQCFHCKHIMHDYDKEAKAAKKS